MGKWVHRLTDVDLEARTAVCAVDGPVDILISGRTRRCRKALGGSSREVPPGQHRMLSKNLETMTGECAQCGPVKVVRRKGSLRCAVKAYEKPKVKPEQLKMKTALRQALRDGKPCEICGGPGEVLDHKHGEKTWRGVLCHKHNSGLGMFEDDPELLMVAANYLRTHEKTKSPDSSEEEPGLGSAP